MKKALVGMLIALALVACGKKEVDFDTLEESRSLSRANATWNVTKYRTVTAKSIVKFYDAKKVLDPCIGWGGRPHSLVILVRGHEWRRGRRDFEMRP